MVVEMENTIRNKRKELGLSQEELAKNVVFPVKQSMQ